MRFGCAFTSAFGIAWRAPKSGRVCVFRSLGHIYAQVSTTRRVTRVAGVVNEKGGVNGGNVAGAKAIGKLVAQRPRKRDQGRVFDRGGYLYQGG